MPEPLFEQIKPRTRHLGRILTHLATVDSTMNAAKARAETGDPHGTTIVADEQTNAIGRRGRTWSSPKGNLSVTLILRPQASRDRLTWIPLIAGAALAHSVHRLIDAPARLKWPNDVTIHGRKVAGILTDAHWSPDGSLAYVLLGIGVNGDRRIEDFPTELQTTATSLSHEAGGHVCLPALLKILLERLELLLDELDAPFATLRERVEPFMATRGQDVRVTMEQGVIEGRARGLGPRGELIIDTLDGERRVDAGDVEHLRRR
jgi:BirA family transcriptional regulator, biotin operon repressor / biotin---[acetyl-CoA-carboxylase] ligase